MAFEFRHRGSYNTGIVQMKNSILPPANLGSLHPALTAGGVVIAVVSIPVCVFD